MIWQVGQLSEYSRDYKGNRRSRRSQVKVDLKEQRLLDKGYRPASAHEHSFRSRGV